MTIYSFASDIPSSDDTIVVVISFELFTLTKIYFTLSAIQDKQCFKLFTIVAKAYFWESSWSLH